MWRVGSVGQRLAGDRGRAPEAAAGEQGGVEVGDELGRGDDVDVVAHRHHTGHARVGDLRGERPVGPDPVVHARRRAVGRVGVGGVGGFGVGRAAGVEHQHRHPVADEQPGQRGSVDQLLVRVRAGVLEQQIAVAARACRPGQADAVAQRRHRHAAVRGLLVEVEVGDVEVVAVPVEVHHVIGPARLPRRPQHRAEPGERRRAQHVELEAGQPVHARRGPAGTRPTGTPRRRARRGGRSPAAPAARSAGRRDAGRRARPGGGCARTARPRRPAGRRCPGRAAAPTAGRARRRGRRRPRSVPRRAPRAGRRPRSRGRRRRRTPRRTAVGPARPRSARCRRRSSVRGGPGTRRSPPGTSAASRRSPDRPAG